MNILMMLIFGFLSARATLDKSGHLMLVEYSINEPVKDEGVVYVDILFHYRGETYKVARHRYPEPVVSIVDTFPWFSRGKWDGGDLEVVARKADGSVERSYISEKSIGVRDLGYEPPKFEHEINSAFVKPDDGPDPYAWRMLGYDPGHTGYYPFSLYPPLDSLWMYDWSGAGTWTTDISGCAGSDMLFIPLAPWGWNRIAAFDVERGDTLWERVVTANAMTSVLSEGDSILFVGTVIGFTPWQDTTFYALDPFTGELKWGKVFKTVQESPIVVDSFVYVPSFGLSRIFCVTYGGDTLWSRWAGFPSPVYGDGMVFHTAPDSVLNARDWLTGELIWDFVGRGDIPNLMGYEGKIMLSPFFQPLYALDIRTGSVVWVNYDYPAINSSPINAGYQNIYFLYGYFVGDSTIYCQLYSVDGNNGITLWNTLFLPVPGTHGGTNTRIVLPKDSLLWIAKNDAVYILRYDEPIILYSTTMPFSPALFSSWSFPIAYKNFFIYANEDYLIVFRADSVGDIPGGEDTTGLKIRLDYINGGYVLRFELPSSCKVRFSLYSLSGARVWGYEGWMRKGENMIYLPKLTCSVYFLKYNAGDLSGVKKILIFK